MAKLVPDATEPPATPPLTPPRPQYLPSTPLPASLRQHIIIHLEEGLHTQALTLLLSLLTSGTTSHNNQNTQTSPANTTTYHAQRPAQIPPPNLLALAATLSVHPAYTTRAGSAEKSSAGDAALSLLRHVVRLVSPVSAELSAAFAFRGDDGGGSAARWRRRVVREKISMGSVGDGGVRGDGNGGDDSEEDEGEQEEERELADLELANAGSLFARAEDFWAVLGWCFNCAARFPARWARWRLWVGVIMDVLEGDWRERGRLMRGLRKQEQEQSGVEDDEVDVGTEDEEVLTGSLVVQYLGSSSLAGRSGRRRIMRAIFAGGDAKSLKEFGEVFKNEAKERKVVEEVGRREKRRKLDIDEGDFGDYAGEEEEEDEDEVEIKSEFQRSLRRSRGRSPVSEEVEGEEERETRDTAGYGGGDAVVIRRRMMVLLMDVAITLPTAFTTALDLIDVYTEFLRPLPLPIFVSLISTAAHATQGFPAVEHSLLLRTLLRTLLSAGVPSSVENGFLTQVMMEEFYLPATANTSSMVDNTKVALCVGYLLRLLDKHEPLQKTVELEAAIQKGIKARKAKTSVGTGGRRGKMGAAELKEVEAWSTTAESLLKGSPSSFS